MAKIKTIDDYYNEFITKFVTRYQDPDYPNESQLAIDSDTAEASEMLEWLLESWRTLVDSAPDTIEVEVHGHGFSDEVDKPINQDWKKQMKGES